MPLNRTIKMDAEEYMIKYNSNTLFEKKFLQKINGALRSGLCEYHNRIFVTMLLLKLRNNSKS